MFFKYNTSEDLLAVTLASMFTVNLVGTVYTLAAAITSTDYEHKTKQSCVEFAWIILHIFRAILYVEASYQISKEVESIRHKVGELSLLVTSVGKAIPSEVDIFQLVVLINNPETNPMGFFTVSRELLGPINKKKNLGRERQRFLLIAFFTLLRLGCVFITYIFSRKFKDKKPKPPMCDICISICALSKAFVSTCNMFFKYNTSEDLLDVTLASMFTVNLVGTVYNFAAAITSTDYEHKTVQSCVELAWLTLHIFRAILYVEASYQIIKEVESIRHKVGELSLLVTSVGKATPLEVDIFQLVVLVNSPETIPMGFFTVSRELLGPIFSTFLTYGIVIVEISSNLHLK
ncbi:unnamed protein product [Pieris brassicae]|uniref:Gustatory receptor n=1 Tax=Pieris brassicae TaxID=7116 RepID=A0A9P0T183_PIEBR|nr:unnamed protein product [Pieris brassicae]